MPSDAQLADGTSRGDDSLVLSLGSTRLNFEYNEVWDIIISMIKAGGLASHDHATLLITAVNKQRNFLNLDRLDFDGLVFSSGSHGYDGLKPRASHRGQTFPLDYARAFRKTSVTLASRSTGMWAQARKRRFKLVPYLPSSLR